MNKSVYTFLYDFSLLILLCWGGHAWFTWGLDPSDNFYSLVIYFIFSLVAWTYKVKCGIELKKNSRILSAFILLTLGSMFPVFGASTLINVIARYIPLWILISDEENFYKHYSFVCKFLAGMLIPSIALYFILLVGAELPFIPMQYGDIDVYQRYLFLNYIFLLKSACFASDRFQAFFLEPGYLGTIMTFLIYANRFDFNKWYNKVYLVSLILSFSLAGYVTFFIGYILFLKSQNANFSKVLYALIFIVGLFFFAQIYNDGDNKINELIVQRLQYDEDRGISGNNRYSDEAYSNFNLYLSNGGLWFGQADKAEDFGYLGAGYVRYFLTNGILSAIFYFLFYYVLSMYSYNKKYALPFLFLIVITFFQAAYPTSFSWMIPFIFAMMYDKLKSRCNSDYHSQGIL